MCLCPQQFQQSAVQVSGRTVQVTMVTAGVRLDVECQQDLYTTYREKDRKSRLRDWYRAMGINRVPTDDLCSIAISH